MHIDADRFANQVTLAYEFMEALHGQAIALIKDVETQLAQTPEELRCLRPGGYKFASTRLSYGLERPQPILAGYYAVCFRHFPGRIQNTLLEGEIPTVAFLKVVLRERGLEHPEARLGLITDVEKPPDRTATQWPKKFEDLVSHLAPYALTGPAWFAQDTVAKNYADSYIRVAIAGAGVRLADLPDSEAIASKIADPLLELYREVTQ